MPNVASKADRSVASLTPQSLRDGRDRERLAHVGADELFGAPHQPLAVGRQAEPPRRRAAPRSPNQLAYDLRDGGAQRTPGLDDLEHGGILLPDRGGRAEQRFGTPPWV